MLLSIVKCCYHFVCFFLFFLHKNPKYCVRSTPVPSKPLLTKPLLTKPLQTKPLLTKPLQKKPLQTPKPLQTKPMVIKASPVLGGKNCLLVFFQR